MSMVVDHLRTSTDRGWLQLRAGAEYAGLRTVAAIGDPVARLALGSARTDPYPIYERMRAAGPLFRSRLRVFVVTSRLLCDAVLRDPRFGRQEVPPTRGIQRLTEHAAGALGGSFLLLDPPDHTRLRRVVGGAFRPRDIRAYAPVVEATVEAVLDEALAGGCRRGDGSFDLMTDFAQQFPIAVIRDLLGIEGGDARRFAQIGSEVGQSLDGVRTVALARDLRTGSDELAALFARLAERPPGPGGGPALRLLTAAAAAGTITPAELTATCGLLLLAGFETTANLIGNAVVALAGRPELWARLATDDDLVRHVVEETLRWDAPVQLTIRFAREPVELAGRLLPVGTPVLVALAAAGRDPAVYAEPDRFMPERHAREPREPEHLAFSSGIHYCLGASLARLEGELALRVLVRRVPGLRLLPGAVRRRGSAIRGYVSLPATSH